jgi:hypothetical protein
MLAARCPCCWAPCQYIPEQVGSIATCPRCSAEFTLPRQWWRDLLLLAALCLLLPGAGALMVQAALDITTPSVPSLPWTVQSGDNAAALRIVGGADLRITAGAVVGLVLALMGAIVAIRAGMPARVAVLGVTLFACLAAAFCWGN